MMAGLIMTKEDSSFTDILAKSKPVETLSVHTNNAIIFLKQLINWQSSQISNICSLLNTERQEIIARLFAMVYLHDIGKSCYSFQKHIRSNDKKSTAFPHALLSLPFVLASAPILKLKKEGYIIEEYIEALAIMSHHTPFYDRLYSPRYFEADPNTQYSAGIDENTHFFKDYAMRFFEYLPKYYKQNFNKEYPFRISTPNLTEKFESILFRVKQPVQRQDRPDILRNVFSFFVAVLHYCDWLSSGKSFYRYSEELLASRLDLYAKQKPYFINWYEIQKEAAAITGNMILYAPTGKGKTEAALWWANSNINSGKVLYLLPTRVTVNAMYRRLKSMLGTTTGLSHGTSVLTIAEDEKWNKSNIIIKRLLFGTFMSPTTVATVDQLLLSQFNWRHWEMVNQNASNAAIIFDEIHAYDFYTLALITEIVLSLANNGSRLAFLSATLPSFLVEHLAKHLPGIKPISDKEFKSLVRHKIDFLNQDIYDATDSIIKEYKNGKKVLVILNTVDTAIDFYRRIKSRLLGLESLPNGNKNLHTNRMVLYHSRFIEKHRIYKEEVIQHADSKKDGFIAITTQVVEVSLNIDYDILFTQLAPLDAMIQRFGRVNRAGSKSISESNVLIYANSGKDELVYGEDNLKNARDITATYLTGKTPTEDHISQLIDLQYPKEKTLDALEKERRNVEYDLKILQSALWDIQTLLLGNRDNALYEIARTRQEKIPDIEVIPKVYEDEIQRLEQKFKLKAIYYLVRLPLYRFKECIRRRTDDQFWNYADIVYNEEEGATACKNN